jgi:hypothetical protein
MSYRHTMPSPCDIYHTNKESSKQKNALCAICNKYTGPNCPASILKYNSSCSLHCVVIWVFICLKLGLFECFTWFEIYNDIQIRALNCTEAICSSLFYPKKWLPQNFMPNTCSHHQIFCWQICLHPPPRTVEHLLGKVS